MAKKTYKPTISETEIQKNYLANPPSAEDFISETDSVKSGDEVIVDSTVDLADKKPLQPPVGILFDDSMVITEDMDKGQNEADTPPIVSLSQGHPVLDRMFDLFGKEPVLWDLVIAHKTSIANSPNIGDMILQMEMLTTLRRIEELLKKIK